MKNLVLVVLSLLIVTSCTFSSKEDGEVGPKAIVPDIILKNAIYTLGQKDEMPIIIEGEKITFYSKDNRAELESFAFYQEDEEGNVVLEGSANKGIINTKSKTMELSGNVRLSKLDEGMEILADALFFDREREEASADGKVVVKSKEGSFKGEDFKGDLKNMVYSFSKMEDGNIDV